MVPIYKVIQGIHSQIYLCEFLEAPAQSFLLPAHGKEAANVFLPFIVTHYDRTEVKW